MNIAYISAALSLIAVTGFAVLWRQHARILADNQKLRSAIAELNRRPTDSARIWEAIGELQCDSTPRWMTYRLRDGLTDRVERLEAARHTAA